MRGKLNRKHALLNGECVSITDLDLTQEQLDEIASNQPTIDEIKSMYPEKKGSDTPTDGLGMPGLHYEVPNSDADKVILENKDKKLVRSLLIAGVIAVIWFWNME